MLLHFFQAVRYVLTCFWSHNVFGGIAKEIQKAVLIMPYTRCVPIEGSCVLEYRDFYPSGDLVEEGDVNQE